MDIQYLVILLTILSIAGLLAGFVRYLFHHSASKREKVRDSIIVFVGTAIIVAISSISFPLLSPATFSQSHNPQPTTISKTTQTPSSSLPWAVTQIPTSTQTATPSPTLVPSPSPSQTSLSEPVMQLSPTLLSLSMDSSKQTCSPFNSPPITITNIGGGTLTWIAGTPTYSQGGSDWLSPPSPNSGTITSGASDKFSFSVAIDTSKLANGAYTAIVGIIPSVGQTQNVSVTVSVHCSGDTPFRLKP